MTLHKSGNLGKLNHNHLTTFGRKVMKRHLKIIILLETIISKIKLFILSGIIAFSYNCEIASTTDNNISTNLLFIASEGNFGQNNGSISVFKDNEKIQELLNVGDVLQSILVHDSHLYAIINGNSEIKRYAISETGLTLPGITISTNNSSPREMCVLNNKLYFSNWNSKDIKVLNLNTFSIEQSISLNGLPEDITTDGSNLYASIPHLALYDQGNGTDVVKIDPLTNQITKTYEVGKGPQHLIIHNGNLFISRTYYSENWYQTFFGTAQVNLTTDEVITIEHGEGIVCGGNVMIYQEQVYRTSLGGIVPIDQNNLSLNTSARIGNYASKDSYYNANLYSSHSIDDQIFFGITNDYVAPDSVYVLDGGIEKLFEVGAAPGDYATWEIN